MLDGWRSGDPLPSFMVIVGEERDVDRAFGGLDLGCEAIIRFIRGKRCVDDSSTLQEWAAALQFPWYFGENWNAFQECMIDLWWLQTARYLFVVTDINLVFPEDSGGLAVMVSLLKDAEETWRTSGDPSSHRSTWNWAKSPVNFHVVFHCEHGRELEVVQRLTAAGIRPELRRLLVACHQ